MSLTQGLDLAWRKLCPTDLQQMLALHHATIRSMGPHQVKAEDPAFFKWLLHEGGYVIGGFASCGSLVAYGVLQYTPDPGTQPEVWFAWPQGARAHKLAGASVASSYRGFALHRELIQRRIALAGPDAYLYATAAPSNPASWRSLMHEGFEIRALKVFYNNSLRYLLAREHSPSGLTATRPFTKNAPHLCDLPQEALASMLDQGWRGVMLPDSRCVLVPPLPLQNSASAQQEH